MMSAESMHVFYMILVMAGVTYAIRLIPFLVFGGKSKPPELIEYLGGVVSPAAIAMLVVYCFKDVSLLHAPFGLPELVSSAFVVALHLLMKNPLLSIFGGTALYMAILQNAQTLSRLF